MSFKKIILFSSIGILSIVLLISYRIYSVNVKYPQRQDITVPQGDIYDIMPGVSMRVIDSKWLDSDDILRDYDDVWYVDNPEDYKAVEVKILLKNYSESNQKVLLHNIYIESEKYDWNGCDADLYAKKNGANMGMDLEPGQEMEYIMPYPFLKQNYRDNDWIQLQDTEYYLVEKRYPVKIKWQINTNRKS